MTPGHNLGLMNSYKLRFALALSVIFLITVGSGALIYTFVDSQLTTETEQRLVSTAESEAHQTERWFDRTDQLIQSSVKTTAVRQNESSFRIADQLTRISNRDAIASTHLLNLDIGKSLVTTGDTYDSTDDGDLPAATRTRIGRIAATDGTGVQYSAPTEIGGQPSMLAVQKTPSGDGRVLVAVIDLRQLSTELFGSAYDDRSTATSVVNTSGITVLSSEPDTILEPDQTGTKRYRGTGFETASSGSEFAVGYAGLENRDLAATNRVPTAQAFEMRSTVGNLIALLLGVLLVGLAGFGMTIGRTTIRSVRSLATSAESLSEGDLDTQIESDRTDEFGTVFDSLEQLRRSLNSKLDAVESERDRAEEAKITAQTAKQEAERERERAEQMNDHLRVKAESYSTIMARAADGDLTQRMQPDSNNPAMVEVAESFNEMMDDLEATFAEIKSFANAVATSSDEATAGTAEITQTTETVSKSIQRIASQTDSQRESLEELSTEMTHHSEATENAADRAETAAALSQEAATVASNGESTAQQSMAEMDAVQDSMGTAVDHVRELADLMTEIDEIVTLIREIASETSMLALNANIEAARAGDGAETGFAVVADEIKQLAEKTHSSATEVADLIEEVQQTTDETAAEIRAADERVEQTTAAVDETAEAFVTVLETIERTDDSLQEITEVTSAQATRAETVHEIAEQIEQQSRSTATDAADASAAAQEQTAAVAQVDASATALASRADRLQSLLDTFDTVDSHDQPTTSAPALSPD